MPPVYEALLLNTVVPQIQAAQAGDSYVMVVNATTPALRITQTGTGNALEVEDSANPDATPFVVSAAGDVGIGTSSPLSGLEITRPYSVDADGAANKWSARFRDTSTAAINVGGSLLFQGIRASSGAVGNFAGVAGRKENATDNNEQGYLAFFTTPATGVITERARITSGGDVHIATGSSTPSSSVAGQRLGATGFIELSRGSGTTAWDAMSFINGNGVVGTINTNGSATAYNTSSDYRLKDNQQPLANSGAFIDALKPKTWNWKADGSKGVGFIAHEVQEVSPGTVVGDKDAVDADGKPVMQAMEYGSAEFIANIVAELQSLRARVAQLEQGA